MLKLNELAAVTGRPIEDLQADLSLGSVSREVLREQIPPEVVRQQLQRHNLIGSNIIAAFINLKGGTGKTTSAVTFAQRSCHYGRRVCVVDIDPQASASFMLASQDLGEAASLIDIWDKPDEATTHLIEINKELRLLPSSLDNSLLDLQLSKPGHQKNALRSCCSELLSNNDLIVVDCPPSLGAGVISTICAADLLVIPTTADRFALRGIELTISETTAIAETFGLEPPKILILLTHYDRRIRMSKEVFSDLQKRYGDRVIGRPIRTSSNFAKALDARKTVFEISSAKKAQNDYDYMTRILLNLSDNAGDKPIP